MEPLSLIVGAALLGIGWVIGRFGHRASRAKAISGSAAMTMCGCGHDLSLHDRQAGECHAEHMRKVGMGTGMKEWARCGCRRYTGPTPLDELLAPPVLPPLTDNK